MSSSSEDDNLDAFLASLRPKKKEKYRISTGSLDNFVVDSIDHVSFVEDADELSDGEESALGRSRIKDVQGQIGNLRISEDSEDSFISEENEGHDRNINDSSLGNFSDNHISVTSADAKSDLFSPQRQEDNFEDDSGDSISSANSDHRKTSSRDKISSLQSRDNLERKSSKKQTGKITRDSEKYSRSEDSDKAVVDEKILDKTSGMPLGTPGVNFPTEKTAGRKPVIGRKPQSKYLDELRRIGSFTPKRSTANIKSVSKISNAATPKIIFSSDSDSDIDDLVFDDSKKDYPVKNDSPALSEGLKIPPGSRIPRNWQKTPKKSSRILMLSDEEDSPDLNHSKLGLLYNDTSKGQPDFTELGPNKKTPLIPKNISSKTTQNIFPSSDDDCSVPDSSEKSTTTRFSDIIASEKTSRILVSSNTLSKTTTRNLFSSSDDDSATDQAKKAAFLLHPSTVASARTPKVLSPTNIQFQTPTRSFLSWDDSGSSADSSKKAGRSKISAARKTRAISPKIIFSSNDSDTNNPAKTQIQPSKTTLQNRASSSDGDLEKKRTSFLPPGIKSSGRKTPRILVLSDDSSDDSDNDVIVIDEDEDGDKENLERNILDSPGVSFRGGSVADDDVFKTPKDLPKKTPKNYHKLLDEPDEEYTPLVNRILGTGGQKLKDSTFNTNIPPRRTGSETKIGKNFTTPVQKPPKVCQTEKFKARKPQQTRSTGLPPGLPLNCEKGAGFKRNRNLLTRRLYDFFNETVFSNLLPKNMIVDWEKRLTKTAGVTKCSRRTVTTTQYGISSVTTTYTARIALSEKVLDTLHRLRDTLCHEMCHAAVWILDNQNDGHGPFWKAWARKATAAHPEMPMVKRCHSYDITYKYRYQCTLCRKIYGRHSKSIKVDKQACGVCRGRLVLLPQEGADGTPAKKRQPNKFALFVKENYKTTQKSKSVGGMTPKHSDVMKALSQQFASLSTKK